MSSFLCGLLIQASGRHSDLNFNLCDFCFRDISNVFWTLVIKILKTCFVATIRTLNPLFNLYFNTKNLKRLLIFTFTDDENCSSVLKIFFETGEKVFDSAGHLDRATRDDLHVHLPKGDVLCPLRLYRCKLV